ncbi:hypothetical protein [Helicobacter sp. MIT 05-5294]|uniref:hypothetical protein n=1 Tax=Helicobacter sp. MIT 05-5294 TaxID=1548150 RepID=UPI0010FE49CC|nr:hypothetical protein [Helicobacter sp. MIT 05-5294]TLD86800.1 hypothetical protein LS69_005685 [Helicobacter sp. MIT 05-5294]
METMDSYLGKEIMPIIGEYFDRYNYTDINFSLYLKHLINLKNLSTLQDNDFSAFGVGLPKRIILEVLDFHQKSNDDFSKLVKKYPFAQMIFTQWLTIKLYEKHKELIYNPKLEYKEFLKNFTSTFNHKPYNLLDALSKIEIQEINYAKDTSFSIIDNSLATSSFSIHIITLYDIIYDIIPNSIRKQFLKDTESLKAYLPLKQTRFYYEEQEISNPKNIFKLLYGEEQEFDINKVPKEYYQLNALYLKDHPTDSIIPKAKINKLGIGYDELLEFIHNDETSLDYPDIWEFELEYFPKLNEYGIDEEGNRYTAFIYKVMPIFNSKHKANFKDIVRLSSGPYPHDAGFDISQGEIHTDEEVERMIYRQYYKAYALLQQNNFHTQEILFESLRIKFREDEEFKRYMMDRTGGKYPLNLMCGKFMDYNAAWYGWVVVATSYCAYRFNQALALSFLNAYDKETNGI